MRYRLGLVCLLLSGCEAITTLEYGAADGVLPMWYEQVVIGLPTSFEPDEWPDGTMRLENPTGELRLIVDTRPDGGRDVSFQQELLLLTPEASVYYRELVGADKLDAIRGVDLQIETLAVDDLDPTRCPTPELTAAGVTLDPHGGRTGISSALLKMVRDKLLNGAELKVPVTLTFHLRPDALDALPPSRLHVLMIVQPTLSVDILEAI